MADGLALLEELLEEVRADGVTVVLTTHHLEEVESLAHRAAILVDGRMKCIGSLQHLKSTIGRGSWFT